MNIVFFLPTFCSGGAEAFVVNAAEELARRGHTCSILSIDGDASVYDARLNSADICRKKLINRRIDNPAVRYLQGYWQFARYLKENKNTIDVMHVNAAQGEELPFVWLAKKNNVSVRVLHSHNSSASSSLKRACHHLCKLVFSNVATCYCACSDTAAEWLLPKKVLASGRYKIIKNGISTERFRFSETSRNEMREEMGVEATRCYICVGRLDYQKNHDFLLAIFKEILKENSRASLLLVGEGPLKDSLRIRATELGIEGSIRWLGVRDDVNLLLCAADCFLLPSQFEGFPFTLVEAQASGLPCVVSDRISRSCAITDLVTFAPLSESSFVKAVRKTRLLTTGERIAYADTIRDAGYDIVSTIDTLENLYINAETI